MWGDWVSKESLVAAGKKVGISKDGLDVNFMQNDKFEQAAKCIDSDKSSTPSTSAKTPNKAPEKALIASPQHVRRNSAKYWMIKYQLANKIIQEASEKSLALNEIPGLLPIDRVKPKTDPTKNTRVTQIHGSLEAKDVLSMVESIKCDKEVKQKAKQERTAQKQIAKEAFYRCKEKCVCGESKCLSASLKECPQCHDILKSVCSKSACRKDGKKTCYDHDCCCCCYETN